MFYALFLVKKQLMDPESEQFTVDEMLFSEC